MMSKRPKFYAWLRRQHWRDDDVGRLAAMALDHGDVNKTAWYSRDRWKRLVKNRAPELLHAFNVAWSEYEAQRDRWVRRLRDPKKRGVSIGLRTQILERDGFRCRRCGSGPQHARLVIDHIVPVARGGLTIAENLQVLCEPCNIGKGSRPPHAHDLAVLHRWDE